MHLMPCHNDLFILPLSVGYALSQLVASRRRRRQECSFNKQIMLRGWVGQTQAGECQRGRMKGVIKAHSSSH